MVVVVAVAVVVVVVAVADSFEGGMRLTVEIPMTLPSVTNLREHWAAKAKRVKAQRGAAVLAVKSSIRGNPHAFWGERLVVALIRVAPRNLDDDNLRGAFKAVRDGVADVFGLDDADPRIEWRYGQAKGRACVRIEIGASP